LDSGNLNDPKIVGGINGGLLNRKIFTEQSKIFDEDIFRMDTYLINCVHLHLKLFRNRALFIFMSGKANSSYRLELLDFAFKACIIRILSGFLVNHRHIEKRQG